MFSESAPGYKSPQTHRTFISEFHLGKDLVEECLGTSMHVFLLDIPRLEFAAIIPKGEFATLCILGNNVDEALVEAFLDTPEVKRCFPGLGRPRPSLPLFPARQCRNSDPALHRAYGVDWRLRDGPPVQGRYRFRLSDGQGCRHYRGLPWYCG